MQNGAIFGKSSTDNMLRNSHYLVIFWLWHGTRYTKHVQRQMHARNVTVYATHGIRLFHDPLLMRDT